MAPVLTVPETVEQRVRQRRGDFVVAHHHEEGEFRQVGPVFTGMAQPTEPYEAGADAAVTDTDELLTAAGLADDELAKLREAGVIA